MEGRDLSSFQYQLPNEELHCNLKELQPMDPLNCCASQFTEPIFRQVGVSMWRPNVLPVPDTKYGYFPIRYVGFYH